MDSANPYLLDKRRLAMAFDRAAGSYEDNAVLQHTVAERMVERLRLFTIEPALILDAGAGTGHGARLLSKHYRAAQVVLLDLSRHMLLEARGRAPRFFSKQRYVQADLEALPIVPQRLDMIFSNLSLQWCNDLDRAFREFRSALKVNGLLTFSTFGPDTLKELRGSWAVVDGNPHVHAFMDMHDVGDALIRAGFSSPVLDVEHFTLTYRDLDSLMRDLKVIGASNAATGRSRSLTGRRQLSQLRDAYERYRKDGVLPATYEVIYGHAWVPEANARPQDGSTVATFPLNQLRRR